MILNPLLVQRLFELVASWLFRPSAIPLSAQSLPLPVRFRRKTIAHHNCNHAHSPSSASSSVGCLSSAQKCPLGPERPWNHHLLSNHGINWASVYYLFFFKNITLSACFFLTHHYFLNTTSSSKIYPKIQSRTSW